MPKRSLLKPVARKTLSDDLAMKIRQLIDDGSYATGDRLPTINEMARLLGVGHPTVREALKKLETVGVVTIRHGLGVYVGESRQMLFVVNPVLAEAPSRKLLLDLVETRLQIEIKTVELAARSRSESDLHRMRELLETAHFHLSDDAELHGANMSFHRAIAAASGNEVMEQMLDVLTSTFRREQHAIINIYGSRERDYDEHVGILRAIEEQREERAVELMRAHLEGIREVILHWNGGDASPAT